MLIETKFDIGQYVWVVSGPEVHRYKIDTISVYKNNKPTYEFSEFCMEWKEDELFATKKEALQKLKEEMLDQLKTTEKALELACEYIHGMSIWEDSKEDVIADNIELFKAKAKEAIHDDGT